MGGMEATAKQKDLKRRATVIYRRDEEILLSANETPNGIYLVVALSKVRRPYKQLCEKWLTLGQLSYVSEYEDGRVIHSIF